MLFARQLAALHGGRHLKACSDLAAFVAVTDKFVEGLPDDCLYQHPETGVVCAADARVDNAGELGRYAPQAAPGNTAALIAGLYLAEENGFAARLCGDYAAAVWDPRCRRLVIVADRYASRGIFYCQNKAGLQFSSDIRLLAAQPGRDGFNAEDFVAWLKAYGFDGHGLPMAGIITVQPGHIAVYENGTIRQTRYWDPANVPDVRFRDAQSYVEAAEDIVREAVRCRLPRRLKVGCQISGGLDSPIIAGTAARLLEGRHLPAFTNVQSGIANGWNGQYWDEHHTAAAFAAGFPNIELIAVLDGNFDLFDVWDMIVAATYWPGGANLVAATFGMHQLRVAKRQGIEVILTGTGGNNTVSQIGLIKLSRLVRQGRIGAYASEWSGLRHQGRNRAQILRSTVAPFLPRELRLRFRPRKNRPHNLHDMLPVHPDILADPEFLKSVAQRGQPGPTDTPRNMATAFAKFNIGMGRDWPRRVMGIEPRSPFMDKRVVEFCAGLPDDCFLHKGETRHLARQMLRRLGAPDRLVNEQRKGIPFANWHNVLMRHRQALHNELDLLVASPGAAKVLDLGKLRRIVEALPSADPADMNHFAQAKTLCTGITFGRYIRFMERSNAGPPLDEPVPGGAHGQP